MNAFLVLVRMQLYLRLSVLKPSHWLPGKNAGVKEWKPLMMGFLFLILIGSMLALVLVMANGILSAFLQMKIPELLLSLVIMVCMVLTLFIGFFHVTGVLYFSKDSAFLAGLPVSSRTAMSARLAVVWLGEAALTTSVFLPVCVLYGVRTGQNALFYVKAVLAVPFIPCIPLAVATLLSFLLIRVSAMFRHRDKIAVIGGFVLIALLIPLQMQFYSRIPDDASSDFFLRMVTDNRALLETLFHNLPPVLWATSGVAGYGLDHFAALLLFLAVSCAAVALPVAVGGRRYLTMSILQNEAYQSARHRKLNHSALLLKRSPLAAMIIREWREVLRVPAYALNGLIGIVMMPIMIVALFWGMKGSSELTALLGDLLRQAGGEKVTLYAAAAMAMVSTINMAGATAVSREGKRLSFTRMIPVSFATQIIAKQLFGFSINLLTCLTTVIALLILIPSQWIYILAAFILGLLFGYAANGMSLALDAGHPKANWRNETEAIKQNTMAMLSMVLGAACAVILGALVWGLKQAGLPLSLVCWLLAGVLAALAVLMHVILKKNAEKWYLEVEL